MCVHGEWEQVEVHKVWSGGVGNDAGVVVREGVEFIHHIGTWELDYKQKKHRSTDGGWLTPATANLGRWWGCLGI